jgi:uncharacterized membrane protein (DUF4010 family)
MFHVWTYTGNTRRHRALEVGSTVAGVALHAQGALAAAQTGTRNGNPNVFLQNAATR